MCGNAFLLCSINKLGQLGKIYTKLFLRTSIRHKLNVANKAKLHDKLVLNQCSCLVGTACLYHIMTCGNRLILDGRNIPQNSEWDLKVFSIAVTANGTDLLKLSSHRPKN